MPKTDSNNINTVGRRKEAIARVRLALGNGQIIVNGKPIETIFPGRVALKAYLKPFEVTNTVNKFNVSVKVLGGGAAGQLSAIVHGISRALLKIDADKHKLNLKKEGLLTRDPRVKERRKYGLAGKARAKKQFSKR